MSGLGPIDQILVTIRVSFPNFAPIFTRDIYAIARICYGNSVCPSVCPSHACIALKRLNISSKFFHCLIGPSF